MRTKRMVINAVGIALYFFLASYVSVRVGEIMKLSFAALPVFVAAFLYGPADGVIVAGLGALLEQLVAYGVGPTTVIWMIPPILRGLTVGLYAKKKKFDLTLFQMGLAVLLSSLLVTTLNMGAIYIDAMVWGYPNGLTWIVILGRYLSSIVLTVFYTLVVPTTVRLIRKGVSA